MSAGIEPIFISVKQAAEALGINAAKMYDLCNKGLVDARYQDGRRLVSVKSLREYAESLPTVRAS